MVLLFVVSFHLASSSLNTALKRCGRVQIQGCIHVYALHTQLLNTISTLLSLSSSTDNSKMHRKNFLKMVFSFCSFLQLLFVCIYITYLSTLECMKAPENKVYVLSVKWMLTLAYVDGILRVNYYVLYTLKKQRKYCVTSQNTPNKDFCD